MSTPHALAQATKRHAAALGFTLCHIVPVTAAAHADFFDHWVAAGRPGEMTYLARNREKRRDPRLLVEAALPTPQSMLVLGVSHYQFDLLPALRDDPSRGLIASYAWGDDYHEIIRPQLFALDEFLRAQSGRTTPAKCLVDTGPVLERDWGQRAGLGFVGKNCCLIHPSHGSWLLLATILVPEILAYDPPLHARLPEPPPAEILQGLPPAEIHGTWTLPASAASAPALTCGRCTRCIDACPTNAFVGPYHLDPQRCISYWTIEAKGIIPRELRPHFGNRIFGCDICQEVCPWNRRLPVPAAVMDGLAAQVERIAPPLLEGFDPANPYWLDQEAFSRRFRRSPIKRAKRMGMLRNVCVALGNWGAPEIVPALTLALADAEPIVRLHAAWAMGELWQKVRFPQAQRRLEETLAQETDGEVRAELAWALDRA
jgi:epoxyqueuosine reductase